MVEVTKSNFEEIFPSIEKAVHESYFIAIDAEFTGLDLGSTNDASLFDSLEERYQKLKARASAFLPAQIGLSLFKKIENENKYLVETYVFYVRPHLCGSTDRRFMCQASCLDFLCRYDFDFNKFIKEGIPYMNEVDEVLLHKEIDEGTVCYNNAKLLEFKFKREIDMLINNKLLKTSILTKEPLLKNEIEEQRLAFQKETICHEYFQVNELRHKYPSLAIYCENDKIIVEKCSPEKRKDLQKNKKNEEENLIDFFLGFTKVLRLIKASLKPIVGHNFLMDLLLFYHNFHRPLPNTYKEFKKELHNLFPVVFDTRHIWLNVKKFYKLKEVSSRSGLFELYEMFKNPTDSLCTLFSPDVEIINSDKYRTEGFPHEAGYDSYVTGWVFLKICHVLALNKITNIIFILPQTFKQHLKAVSPFENKINIARSNIRYINLAGNDPIPLESQLLYISARNRKFRLNHNELSKLFDKYGMIEFKLKRSEKEAVIAVGNLQSYREILRDFQGNKDYSVIKYSFLRHSTLFNTAIWVTTIGMCSIATFFVVKHYSHT